MKHTPAHPTSNLTFDELVSRAKAGETNLSPAQLDGMLRRFETRLKVEGGTLASNTASTSAAGAPGAARATKLGAAGKTLLSGAGIAAVAAFLYSSTVSAPDPTRSFTATDSTTPQTERPAVAQAPQLIDRGAPAINQDGEVTPHAGPAVASDEPEAKPATRGSTVKLNRAPSLAPRLTQRSTSEAQSKGLAAVPGGSSQANATAVVERAAEQPAVVAATPTNPAPALDTSLAQLERAERELRTGHPKAALTTLALPVVPSLSSRVEALRAVALCQSGQTAAGRRLGTQHLVRNPRSPYEQRLQRACGEL